MEPPTSVPANAGEMGNATSSSRANARPSTQLVCNDQIRCLFVGQAAVRFTPIEYRLVSILVTRLDMLVSYDKLIRVAFGAADSPSVRTALFKHLDRIRTKLRPLGLDVPGVTKYGCILTWGTHPPTNQY